MLASLFFSRFGQISTSLVIKSGYESTLSVIFQIFTPLYFAAPACLYLYITGFIDNRNKLTKVELLHFLPALLAIIHVFPWPGSKALDWNLITAQLRESGYLFLRAKSGLFPAYFHYAGRPILSLVYLVLSWHAILKFKINNQVSHDNHGRNWIIFLLKVATFFQLAGLIPLILNFLNISFYHSFFIILNCIVLLTILTYALHRPNIFYGYLLVAIDWDKKEPPIKEPALVKEKIPDPALLTTVNEPVIKAHVQKKLNLSPEQTSNYAVLIRDIMEREQLYLQPGLQIIDLATRINIPVHHCSHIINNHIGKNFRDWINGYRVEYFLRQYPLQSDKITIEAIAQESGFKSQATFYNAFKKEKGVMPTVYFSQGSNTNPG
ncbi:helix-turn-helix domain-containing protein [Pedobacter sp. N23S346]|uniref:helix-turn-helix domain-containing protein n=1 Tax=Pedobacter sp. N23S346 TaxID=3402750 RepID=UPI003ACD7B96